MRFLPKMVSLGPEGGLLPGGLRDFLGVGVLPGGSRYFNNLSQVGMQGRTSTKS